MITDNKNKFEIAQASLEMVVAFICVLILLFAAMRVFVWVNGLIVQRQEDFENTRVAAASNDTGVEIDESNYPKLDIFNK